MISFLTLLFPRRCVICDEVVAGEKMICDECISFPKMILGDTCMCCGKMIKPGGVYCYDCKKRKHFFKRNIAVFEYNSIKQSLYRFKYFGRIEYARFYADVTYSQWHREIMCWKPEAIVPVPSHKRRKRKRGYNQAEEFAKELSYRLGIPLSNDLVIRQKSTKPMKLLSREQRQNNLKKAFILNGNDVKLDTIILVDDIYTTGTTIDCIAKECQKAGIRNIYSVTIAVGNGI